MELALTVIILLLVAILGVLIGMGRAICSLLRDIRNQGRYTTPREDT